MGVPESPPAPGSRSPRASLGKNFCRYGGGAGELAVTAEKFPVRNFFGRLIRDLLGNQLIFKKPLWLVLTRDSMFSSSNLRWAVYVRT